jgi:chemotaxis protein CheC
MAGAVVDYVLIDLSKSGDWAMMVETDFTGEDGQEMAIKGHFFLLPDPVTLNIFLEAAGAQA